MILAALASGAVIAAMDGQAPPPGAFVPRIVTELPTPNLYSQPAHCKSVVQGEVARQMTAFRGQLPAAQYAVVRKLDGCDVPTPVGYHPAAEPSPKREDAPSNRR